MSKVTSKLQVTIPKAVAERYRIAPGDEIEFVPAGDALRVVLGPAEPVSPVDGTTERLQVLDALLARHRAGPEPRQPDGGGQTLDPRVERGWTREDLYEPPRGWPRDWPL